MFDTALGSGNVDLIADFVVSTTSAHDTIPLARSVFTALGAGALTQVAFKIRAPARSMPATAFSYSKALGARSYDADGSGTASAVQFAILDTKPTLSYLDFLMA